MPTTCPTAGEEAAPARPGARAWVQEAALVALTVGIAALGAGLFKVLHLPAAFLTGSATSVVIALLAGVPVRLPDRIRMIFFAVLVTAMGAGVTPEAIAQLLAAPVAMVGLVLVIAATTAASAVTLVWLGGWDRMTALCGSIPGNLPLVLSVAMESGARMDRVVVSQSVRLFILLALIPLVLSGGEETHLVMPPHTALDVAFTLVVTMVSLAAATLVRLPSAAIVGPLIGGAAVSMSGVGQIAIPGWLAEFSLMMVGTSVALRLEGARREGMFRMVLAAVAAFVASVSASIGMAMLFALLLAMPLGTVFIAFAPGGLDAMIALAFLLSYDVAFVAIMHTSRMIILSLTIPTLVAILGRRGWGADRD